MCTQYKLFLLEAKFKTTHCPFGGVSAGQKLGDNVVSLSQRNAVSTLFLMGKFFIKFFHQNPGVFFAISLLSSQWCQVRGLSCPSPMSLGLPEPPVVQQSTSFVVFWRMWGWRVRAQGGCYLSLSTLPSPFLGKVAGNRILLNPWLASGQKRQDPQRAFFF